MSAPLKHFFVSIDGRLAADRRALLSARAWAPTADAAAEMLAEHARHRGFAMEGRWIIYDSFEPEEPAGPLPSLYRVRFIEYAGETPLNERRPPGAVNEPLRE